MGILLVYDVTDEGSFNNIRNWMRNIEQHASDTVNKVRSPCPAFPTAQPSHACCLPADPGGEQVRHGGREAGRPLCQGESTCG